MINEEKLLKEIKNKQIISIKELIEIIDNIKITRIPNVKSAPEAILYYYIYNYIDKQVKVNELSLTTIIDDKKYIFTADLSFSYNNKNYILEFDSLSYHSKSEEIIRDNIKNKLFKDKGYIVIRLRNSTKTKFLPDLKNCYNLKCKFNYFSKKELIDDNRVLHELFNYIGVKSYDFNLCDDFQIIECEPYWIWKKY